MREGGGNCLKYLKRGTQRFNKGVGGGGQAGSWGGCLKKGESGTPLQTMILLNYAY